MMIKINGIKGISPLIASVLLIAFTLAIAGIFAAWVTTWVKGEVGGIKPECIGALDTDIDYLRYENNQLTLIVINKKTMSMSGLKAVVTYPDATVGEFMLKDYGATDPLLSTSRTTATITNLPSKPDKVSIFATTTCPEYEAGPYTIR